MATLEKAEQTPHAHLPGIPAASFPQKPANHSESPQGFTNQKEPPQGSTNSREPPQQGSTNHT